MNTLKAFFAKYSITTHSLVAFTFAVIAAYNQVPQFHDYVLALYTHAPLWLRHLVETVIAVVMWYWRGRAEWTPEQRAQLNGK